MCRLERVRLADAVVGLASQAALFRLVLGTQASGKRGRNLYFIGMGQLSAVIPS